MIKLVNQLRWKSCGRVVYDFRSDTVTKPTQRMLQRMMQSSMGDDVYEEDQSTQKLEQYMAKLTGHEAALFCVTGTMTNQLAFRSWLTGALQSVLLDSRSHVWKYENHGIAYHCQAGTLPVAPDSKTGHLTVERIAANVLGEDVHQAKTRLVSLENTLSGSIFPFDEIQRIREYCTEHNLILHCDGARLWNASAATGISIEQYCTQFDSVSLCLSKGIGAPIGSILVGNAQLIAQARHYRKLFGGGWRQSGPLAEAAHCAIQEVFVDRDADGHSLMMKDHLNALWLSQNLLKAVPSLRIMNKVETNMVFLNVRDIVPGRSTSVKGFVDAIDNCNKDTSNANKPCIKLANFGYSYDQLGTGRTKDEDYVLRLVLHHQTPREACELLVDHVKSCRKHLK
ncbi:hypothetical protein MIR68_005270 [Amoeboaphelidium protococcarum]|nr:hypothetical protein MIR68_005270 [Amoeboaphelidium protococcarum]